MVFSQPRPQRRCLTCPNGRRKRNATTQNSSPLPHALSASTAEVQRNDLVYRQVFECFRAQRYVRGIAQNFSGRDTESHGILPGAVGKVCLDLPSTPHGSNGSAGGKRHTVSHGIPTAATVWSRAAAHRCWRPSGRDRMSVDGAASRGWIHSECLACVRTRLEMVLPQSYTPLAPVPVHVPPIAPHGFLPAPAREVCRRLFASVAWTDLAAMLWRAAHVARWMVYSSVWYHSSPPPPSVGNLPLPGPGGHLPPQAEPHVIVRCASSSTLR